MTILRDPFDQNTSQSAPAPRAPASDTGFAVPEPAPRRASATQTVAQDGAHSDLQRRRDTLAEQVTEMHWDLGGLAYEMAIRDHFRLDVLVRRAAALQERDAELAEVERLLRMEHDGVAGSCPSCGAPHSRGALFCWQCGITLMERRPSDAIGQGEDTASVMDELLAHQAGQVSERAASTDE
jgi:hypothetical protein